jgi:hypothetical protein
MPTRRAASGTGSSNFSTSSLHGGFGAFNARNRYAPTRLRTACGGTAVDGPPGLPGFWSRLCLRTACGTNGGGMATTHECVAARTLADVRATK